MSEQKMNIHAQMEHLQLKYQGTGHADTTREEWITNMQRDTLASHVAHRNRLMYMALACNESVARVRQSCLDKMINPLGVPSKGSDMDVDS
jgi:splicing factor 3B subunit 5